MQSNEALELRRIALVLRGAGAIGEAVPEREDHRVAREARQFRVLAATREGNRDQQ